MSFTKERTKRPENIVVSTHVSAHALSEMRDYAEKLQCIVYEQKYLPSWCYALNLPR